MYKFILNAYAYIFGRPTFQHINNFIAQLGLHGLGIDNYETARISGEYWVYNYLLKNNNKPLFLDIGAFDGDTAILIKSINHSSIVHSFEPNPASYKQLNKISKKHQFFAYPLAVSSKSTYMTLYDISDHSSSQFASLYSKVISHQHNSNHIKKYRIKTTTIDEFYQKYLSGTLIDLIKIDVEGHELSVLQGARKVIKSRRVKAILFEFNRMNIQSKAFFADYQAILKGYDLYRLLPNGIIKLNSNSLLSNEIFAYQNILALEVHD